jgi:hypothetical protein
MLLSTAGARVLYVGGNANNGGNDGPGYVNANNGLSNANANIGCRLAEKFRKIPQKEHTFPHRSIQVD